MQLKLGTAGLLCDDRGMSKVDDPRKRSIWDNLARGLRSKESVAEDRKQNYENQYKKDMQGSQKSIYEKFQKGFSGK